MRNIPTEKELEAKVKLVEVPVRGSYIARIDERRKTARNYEIKVKVPEGFNLGDLKRATARTLLEHPDLGDFVTMRTFEQKGKAVPLKETMKLKDFYSVRELERIKRLRDRELADERKARGNLKTGKAGDTSDYNEKTGLPELLDDVG